MRTSSTDPLPRPGPSAGPLVLERVCRRLAFAVPLVVTMLRTSPTSQWRDDLGVVRALGLVPTGSEGMVSTAFTQALALLPIGGRLVRAGWVSALGLAVASAFAYRLLRLGLEASRATPRLSPALALGATLTAVLAPSWQLEGTLAGGVTVGVALALATIFCAVSPSPRGAGLALGALTVATVAESHSAGLALMLALGAVWLVERRLPGRTQLGLGALGATALAAGWLAFLALRPLAPHVTLDLSGGLGASSLMSVDAAAESTSAIGAWLADAGILPCVLSLVGLALGLARRGLLRVFAPFVVLVICDLAFPAKRVGLLAADSFAPVRLLALVAIASASALAVQAIAMGVRRARVPFAEPASALLVAFHFTLAFVAAEDSAYAADRREQVAADAWTDEAFASLPPAALLLVRSEALAYRLWAAQVARGARSDLVVIPATLLERGNVTLRLLQAEPALAPLIREMALTGTPSEFALSNLSDARPLFVEIDPSWSKRLRDHLAPRPFFSRFIAHPLGRSDRNDSLGDGEEGWQRALAVASRPRGKDPATLAVLTSELRDRARLLVDVGDSDAASSTVQRLRGIDANDVVAAELEARLLASAARTPAAVK